MSLITPISFFSAAGSTPPFSVGNAIQNMYVSGDDKVFAVGRFSTLNSQSVSSMCLIYTTTDTTDTTFLPKIAFSNETQSIFTLALSSNSTNYRFVVGGSYTSIDSQANSQYLAVVNPSSNGTTFVENNVFAAYPTDVGYVYGTEVSDKIYVCGLFDDIGTTARRNIAAYNLNGTLNTSFIHNSNNYIRSVLSAPDDPTAIYAIGGFTSITGYTRRGIAKLDKTSGSIVSFNANSTFSSGVNIETIAVDESGSPFGSTYDVLLGTIDGGGTDSSKGVRLTSTGVFLYSYSDFLRTATGRRIVYVYKIAFDPSNRILISVFDGLFYRTYRLNNTSPPTLDTTFNTVGYIETDDRVNDIKFTSTQIYLGGKFTLVAGQPRSLFARLNTSGAVL